MIRPAPITMSTISIGSSEVTDTFNQRKFWFVGMIEMMYTSLCLLKYKMGVYNSTLCDYSSRTSSKIPHEDHHSSHAISPSRNTKQVILSHSKQDVQIYDASYQFFEEELHSTETQSSINFSSVTCATCWCCIIVLSTNLYLSFFVLVLIRWLYV